MKIVHQERIVQVGNFSGSEDCKLIEKEISDAIHTIVWPPGADGFYLDPKSKGRGRGEGNGVKPIKDGFVKYLESVGWQKELTAREKGVAGTGPLDVVKKTSHGFFAAEWETGNISSTHRALNKICLGVQNGELIGGALILPSRELYKYLTDRIGNYPEIVPYLPFWKNTPFKEGSVSIFVVEHDGLKEGVPRITKGTDGRALL